MGAQSKLRFKMKYFVLALCLFASAQAHEDCELCLDKIGVALAGMNAPDAVPKVIDLLVEKVCPTMPDPEACKVGVATYWPKVSDKIFDPVAAQYICGPDFIMECPEPTPEPPSKQTRNEWTCDDCLVDIDILESSTPILKLLVTSLKVYKVKI